MNVTARRLDRTREADLLLPNEPFKLWGRMVPTFDGERWAYRTEEFPPEEVGEMVFPDEGYDFDGLRGIYVGAYDEEDRCVGLAVYQPQWHKYLYLYDLKVNAACRGQGVGKRLVEEGKKLAAELGLRGVWTVGQDNNLSACLFYIKEGFQIGGLDTRVYTGTGQEGKRDIFFYLDL